MTFWITAALIALAAAGLPALALLRPRASAPAAPDVAVYRGQLAEIDRDLARGTIAPEDAERTRTEIARRLLAADAARLTPAPARPSPALAIALLALLTAGSLALYNQLGVPGYPDLALADRIAAADQLRQTRPSQAEAEAQAPTTPPLADLGEDYLKLVQQLRDTVATRPDDLQGQTLLARHEIATGNTRAAYAAQKRVIDLKRDDVRAEDFTTLADMLILAAGGYVSPEAEAALDAALALEPRNGIARYYTGLMMAQTGRPDIAFRIWNDLLNDSTPQAPWFNPTRSRIAEAAARAGIEFDPLPPMVPTPGPTAEDVANAEGMSAEDRQQMIQSMVDGLAVRLAANGGPASDWARLISSLAVLGDTDRARAVATEARTAFADDPDGLAEIEAAARAAGITP